MSLSATIILIILIGFLSTVLASMMGLGGGLVAVPLIMLVIGGEHNMAAKLISYVNIAALATFSAYKYYRQKRKPLWTQAFFILLGVVPAAVVSSIYLGPLLNDYTTYFHFLYAAVVVVVIVLINIKDRLPKYNINNYYLPLFGLVIGILSGSIGLSGGVLFVPLLVVGLSVPLKEAAVTSLVLKLGAASVNILTDAIDGQYTDMANTPGIMWYFPIIIIVGSLVGSFVGPVLNKKVSDKSMRTIFNSIMFLMFAWEVTNGILMMNGISI